MTTETGRQRRGLPPTHAMRVLDGGRATAEALPALDPPAAPDPWASVAQARLAHELDRAREAEIEGLRQALSDRDREIRILKCELESQQADHECTVEDMQKRIAEAERRGRHEAARTARHGGRLPSILAVRS